MLLSLAHYRRDQLLSDLIGVKERLAVGWRKGGFGSAKSSVCIVGGCEIVTGHTLGFHDIVKSEQISEMDQRLGRLILTIYSTLLGPKAPLNVTIASAMRKIAGFNDSVANEAAVMLLLDRAIEAVLAPVSVE